MATVCIKWNEAHILWNDNPYTWDDVCIAEEIVGSGIAGDWVGAYDKLDKRKKKRVIEVIAMIEGEKFKQKKVYDPNIKVTASQIKKFVQEVLNVEIIEIED